MPDNNNEGPLNVGTNRQSFYSNSKPNTKSTITVPFVTDNVTNKLGKTYAQVEKMNSISSTENNKKALTVIHVCGNEIKDIVNQKPAVQVSNHSENNMTASDESTHKANGPS